MQVTKDGDVFIVTMNDGENRFRPEFNTAMHAALDQAEHHDGPAALVVTGSDKFFSNGLDLDWVLSSDADEVDAFFASLYSSWARILAFPGRTVAAINGHAFAGGAMLSLAFDFRVMRSDRGYWCLPEADLGLPLAPEMHALVTGRLNPMTAHRAIVDGPRYGAEQALADDIVDFVEAEADVLAKAVEIAAASAHRNRDTQRAMKEAMYPEVLRILRREGA